MRWLLAVALLAGAARADDSCPQLTVSMTPSENLQIVAWLEDAAGNYVDTIFITDATGLRGIGNRPGQFGMKSGPLWPYGKRLDVFPIWAHRHGQTFPMVVWQSFPDETGEINAPFGESSREAYFCRPLVESEAMWDTGTCATVVFTDKGTYSPQTVGYPPRADHPRANADSADVDDFPAMNPFDTISRATPAGNAPYGVSWALPAGLPDGNYVVRVEVSKEFDKNASYNDQTLETPRMDFDEYGLPYRGQPSVLYEVPITIGATDTSARVADYAGYGDPDGLDGTVRAPDNTIEVGTPGSGAGRLLLAADADPYRVRVDSMRGNGDVSAPGAITEASVDAAATSAEVTFRAPGDDGAIGEVKGYEVRYRLGGITEETFESGIRVADMQTIVPAGNLQTLALAGLRPAAHYGVAIRAFDDCLRNGPIVVMSFDTERRDDAVGCCNAGAATNAPLAFVLLVLLRRRRSARR
jgi:hypothetical protein